MHEGACSLAADVLSIARERGASIGTAESCTGGLVAAALTAPAGASDVFCGGIVSYWPEVKEDVLGVPHELIERYGVVSSQVAEAMAAGAARVLGCDFTVATTGIAGPTGAEPGKPVGTVCYGCFAPHGLQSATICQGRDRDDVRACAVENALRLLRDALLA